MTGSLQILHASRQILSNPPTISSRCACCSCFSESSSLSLMMLPESPQANFSLCFSPPPPPPPPPPPLHALSRCNQWSSCSNTVIHGVKGCSKIIIVVAAYKASLFVFLLLLFFGPNTGYSIIPILVLVATP